MWVSQVSLKLRDLGISVASRSAPTLALLKYPVA